MIRKLLLAITLCVLFNIAVADIARSSNLVLMHSELSELNLSKELVMTDRLDMVLLSDKTNTDVQVDLTKRLNELGWAVSWQDIRATQGTEEFIANFYKYGGKHLRLEVSDIGNNSYEVMLYQY